ncbi:MaoC family dehydratase [Prescottella equi]|uniref:MaoC family dehydratase n=1 Tax=Rhodococcus hoagii TaxID=43767 RepID=UPI00301D94A1
MTSPTSLDTPAGAVDKPAPYARGLYWTEMKVGSSFSTASRTVTESDLVRFVSMGFTEPLFMDATGAAAAGYRGRLVPGALTFSLAEGLVMLTNVIHGTGMAFLGTDITVKAPVFVGDTLAVSWTVTSARPASSGRRGVVTTSNLVRNQHGDVVMEYTPVRLIAAAPEPTGEGNQA